MKKIFLLIPLLFAAELLWAQKETDFNIPINVSGSLIKTSHGFSSDGITEIAQDNNSASGIRLLQVSNSEYYKRLFYLCKAWGFAKYHHTQIANGSINWDDELFKAIYGAKLSFSNNGFNDSLQMILNNAGTMGYNSNILPVVFDSLNNNKDMSWIQNSIFSDTVRSLLDTIRSRFRPQPNIYVGSSGSSPGFGNDQLFYQEANFPTEEKRLLALFRYWNIINYFFPYKNIMDQNWDTTLVEFIPKIVGSNDSLSYSLCFKSLTTRINDSHAAFYSPTYSRWNGGYYPPFQVRYIENEMVITNVLPGIPNIKAGDVIKQIDCIDIYYLRDSLRKYASGSNVVIVERELNSIIMSGPSGTSQITLFNGHNLESSSFVRNTTNYTNLNLNNSPIVHDTIINGNKKFRIVDMGRLTSGLINDVFYELTESDAIIFDIRNNPQGTLWSMVNYLFPGPLPIANCTVPDITFPGRLYWSKDSIGSGTPNPYKGKIILLFDERTQSQAEYTCMGLEKFPGAVKIGSTTAGADGGVSQVFLPGKIYTYFTGLGTFYPDYKPTQRVGIIPDFEVHPTIAGIRAGIDEVLAYALNLPFVSVKQRTINEKMKLFPNPFGSTLNYELSAVEGNNKVAFEILDIFGRTIARLDKYTNQGAIEFPDVPNGAYIVKISTNKQMLTQLVIKQ